MQDAQLSPHIIRRLIESAAVVAGQTDLTAVLNSTVRTAMELTGARYGALGVLGEHGMLAEFLHAGIEPTVAAKIGPPPSGRGVLGTITRVGKTIRLDRISDHPDSVGFPEHHPPMETFLGVPIRLGDAIYGNLYLTEKREGGFTEGDEQLVEALAVIAGAAINSARLHRRMRRVAVVEDRERIARDLHDAIIQDLFAVGLTLQAQSQKVTDPEMRAGLTDAVTRLDDAIAALRRFIFDLRPPVWTQRDLQGEITDMVAGLAESHGAEVDVVFQGALEEIPASLVDDAIQVIREAVSNALRHAGTDHVEVMIRKTPDALQLMVCDRGRGFDPETPVHGMGLDNMRTRAARAGGEASIETAPGKGTTVKVTFPL